MSKSWLAPAWGTDTHMCYRTGWSHYGRDLLNYVSVDAQGDILKATQDMELRVGLREVLVIQGNRQYLPDVPFAAVSAVQVRWHQILATTVGASRTCSQSGDAWAAAQIF